MQIYLSQNAPLRGPMSVNHRYVIACAPRKSRMSYQQQVKQIRHIRCERCHSELVATSGITSICHNFAMQQMTSWRQILGNEGVASRRRSASIRSRIGFRQLTRRAKSRMSSMSQPVSSCECRRLPNNQLGQARIWQTFGGRL